MINDNLNSWLNSGEYKADLSEALTKMVKGVSYSDNESEVAQHFTLGIYELLKEKADFTPPIKTEVKISGIVHQFNGENKVSSDRVTPSDGE
ncbi:MAG: hypothetical protein LUD17_15175 [Bacteroidales bacterium]|nr:hypothetical protein [Bacteroidales bacterium]